MCWGMTPQTMFRIPFLQSLECNSTEEISTQLGFWRMLYTSISTPITQINSISLIIFVQLCLWKRYDLEFVKLWAMKYPIMMNMTRSPVSRNIYLCVKLLIHFLYFSSLCCVDLYLQFVLVFVPMRQISWGIPSKGKIIIQWRHCIYTRT